MDQYKVQKPFQFIIFGATGDLASLKLFPAFFELFLKGKLPENFSIIGFGRTVMNRDAFRKIFKLSILRKKDDDDKEAQEAAEKLLEKVEYFVGQYTEEKDFHALFTFCDELLLPFKLGEEADGGSVSSRFARVAYFSIPPNVFEPVIKNLAVARDRDGAEKCQDLRVVIEKPFGTDANSAAELFHVLSGHFYEEKIYLLDHYLGKKPIQSILKLRMENNVMNTMLQGSEIANIQITAFEEADVGKRVGYFDQVGIMKDMIQSHLLQILALIAMEIPLYPTVESLQREKNNIVSAVRFSGNSDDAVFGQYESYRQEKDGTGISQTDTFCAVKLFIDRRNWFNVPIYLRTGKKMEKSYMRVVIEFKKMPFQGPMVQPNRLIFELRPSEELTLELDHVKLSKTTQCEGDDCLGDYSSLIFDILSERKLNFLSFPEILAAWKVIDEVGNTRKKLAPEPEIYKDISSGPTSYLTLPVRDGFHWYDF